MTQWTAELIPQPTAELIEKSFAQNTVRNRRQALQQFQDWLQGRQSTDGLLAAYITHLFNDGKAPGKISIVVAAVKWLLKSTFEQFAINSRRYNTSRIVKIG